jgi:hypothetical protein
MRTHHIPNCSRCGGPATNVNSRDELTGEHRDVEECLGQATFRLARAEHNVRALVNACLALLLETSEHREAHGAICATDPCGRCIAEHALGTVQP